ncbi:MAG: response regulator transcription factor [Fusobacteria bacterium]|nr:response regulator transcription factor [Fusobacteriota bacterium]
MNMKKILIIEDEEKIRKVIKNLLVKNNYTVFEAENGIIGLNIYESEKIDLVLLDIMMPEMDGWTVCREIKKKENTPIIMLTARGSEGDELFGFELGVDDYIKKPFSLGVLLARINAVFKKHDLDKNVINLGNLKIDEKSRKVYFCDNEIILAPKEYELLSYMAKNKGIALSREKILQKVWEFDYFGDLRTVDTHIKKLRKKLDGKFIDTVRGYGYRFEEDKI